MTCSEIRSTSSLRLFYGITIALLGVTATVVIAALLFQNRAMRPIALAAVDHPSLVITGAPDEPAQFDDGPAPTFDGRPLVKVRTMQMLVTAYSPDTRSCGRWADASTASGYSIWINGMKLVAADTDLLPFGTILTVPGYHANRPVQVLDRGKDIRGQRLDVLFPNHESARQWGKRTIEVAVWRFAE
ncbi:MAG: hypothetical protein CMJ18_03920 [Phycisphaeraceae bacterium]|nr:hypothetical protein [Phycisphaeraceae bacterium]